MTSDDLLLEAQNAFRLGDRQTAASLFARLVLENQLSEEGWLGLAFALEDREKSIHCLHRVLALNPKNQAAQQALDELQTLPPPASPKIPAIHVDEKKPAPHVEGSASSLNGDNKSSRDSRHDSHKTNWVLWIGMILVGLILLIVVFGPAWAPRNPMEENYTLTVDGKIKVPPYPPFKIDGFLLGTDRFGRDLWSQILWGVRPTMLMVVSVAGFRLILGTILGLVIGWSQGRTKRALDSLLSAALSIPVLIIAIIGIYLVGIQRGLLAFIIGLGITGWAETARLVSEQTRVVKGQLFIDAVRSMGASDRYILFVHVLRHILPLLWMLLAFEISSTLLVTAELGFLGYYIGGGVYVEVSDFVAVNTTGLPELGQMLSTVLLQKLTDPLALIIVGTVTFVGVLGFNLLGEGLRREVTVERLRSHRFSEYLPQSWGIWLESHLISPVSNWLENRRKIVWIVVSILILAGGIWAASRIFHLPVAGDQGAALQVPGGHLWASERHDPFGTKWVPVSMDTAPEITWSVTIPGGPTGGPAVNKDGVVYIAGEEQVLLAIQPDGTILWEAPLEAVPVGGPALDAAGNIYVADQDGGVTAIAPTGDQLWRSQASTIRDVTAGPIVSEAGMVYVTVIDTVAAISSEGELIWREGAADIYVDIPPQLSARQDMVFLLDSALEATAGTRQTIELVPAIALIAKEPAFFTGADGLDYYRYGHEIMDWHLTDSGAEAGESRTWLYQSQVIFNPIDQGMTPSGLGWLYYTSQFTLSRIVWLDDRSHVVGNYLFMRMDADLIAFGGKDEAYLCGATGAKVECINISPQQSEPTWSIMIDVPTNVVGGALIPGRFYVALEGDSLYALEPPK